MDAHLDAIERVLAEAGAARHERRRVVDEVERQVLDMLEQRLGGQADPTPADVAAILAELDPPEAYGSGQRRRMAEHHEPPAETAEPRMARTAIWGCVIGLVALALSPVPWLFFADGPGFDALNVLAAVMQMGVIAGAVAMVLLGIIALVQIQGSRGRLYGTALALFDVLLHPVILLLVLLFSRVP